MNSDFYDSIFRRKSFHVFRGTGNESVSREELADLEAMYPKLETLNPEIRTAIRIVPADKIRFKGDAEYCVLFYSENKPNHRVNIGYIGEQLELYLVSRGIGTLWFGLGKPDEKSYQGLDYVIMLAIRKVSDPGLFRQDERQAKRKPLSDLWQGEDPGIARAARLAPSAVNSQPWFTENDGTVLRVYRSAAKRGLLSTASLAQFNEVDMGIYLCTLEIAMSKMGLRTRRSLFPEQPGSRPDRIAIAEYHFTKEV